MKPAAEDLDRRRPVWDAMQELFLDTEHHYDYVARRAIESEYADEELREILLEEVFPALAFQRRLVIPEWREFDLDWLTERILKFQRRAWRWPTRWRLGFNTVREEWNRVQEEMVRQRLEARVNDEARMTNG